jgi:flagellar hook-associated protein 1 FlgK
MYDRFLTSQVSSAQTQVSELETLLQPDQADTSMLADPNAGLVSCIAGFFCRGAAGSIKPISLAGAPVHDLRAQTHGDAFSQS